MRNEGNSKITSSHCKTSYEDITSNNNYSYKSESLIEITISKNNSNNTILNQSF